LWYSAQEFAKYGAAGLVLHYYGDPETEAEVQSLKKEIESNERKVVVVPGKKQVEISMFDAFYLITAGDISDASTSQKVRVRALPTVWIRIQDISS